MGRNYQGVDCSIYSINSSNFSNYLPRNSNDQMQYCSKYKQLDNIKEGVFNFWDASMLHCN